MASSSQKQGTAPSPLSDSSVYHEKQSRWRCGLHAVNALLRRPAFTPADFDEIADSLLVESQKTWLHPHRSIIGMGDYDANVLLVALSKEGFSSNWVSSQDDLRTILAKGSLSGFLVNVEVRDWIHNLLRLVVEGGRHWIAVPRYPGGFFLVDSKHQSPVKFKSEAALLGYLENVRADVGHILAIERSASETSAQ